MVMDSGTSLDSIIEHRFANLSQWEPGMNPIRTGRSRRRWSGSSRGKKSTLGVARCRPQAADRGVIGPAMTVLMRIWGAHIQRVRPRRRVLLLLAEWLEADGWTCRCRHRLP
jgi:hypothetical protein